MPRRLAATRTTAAAALAFATLAAARATDPPDGQHASLAAHSVLPAATYRTGSPPSGEFLSAAERATAAANGVHGPSAGPLLEAQPVQGFSSMIPGEGDTWWTLADNGYAWRGNSADSQLAFHRLEPRWEDPGGPTLLETVVLRDPDHRIPWMIVCDQSSGTPLPAFSFNVLPPPPAACGGDPAARLLTGFDFDPESFVRAPDGTFWVGEEFGPFLVHVAADGRVLEPPVQVPGVRSPQSPFLDIADRAHAERPTLATSRGFEGVAIAPDGSKLYALLEGAVAEDDPRDLRLYVFDLADRAFAPSFLKVRLEMASQKVNLAALADAAGVRIYPDVAAPPAGPVSIGELKAVNDRHLLLIERDDHGDDLPAPRFKKVFLLDLLEAPGRDGYVGKTLLIDLLAIPDPLGLGGDGDFFRLPFSTIESVHMVDDQTILVASDNNFPFSNGRSRSRSADRKGPLAADGTEIVLVHLGAPLDADPRLLPETFVGGRPAPPALAGAPPTGDRDQAGAPGLATWLSRLDRVASLYRETALRFTCSELMSWIDRNGHGQRARFVYVYTVDEKAGLKDYRMDPSLRGDLAATHEVEPARYGVPRHVERGFSWIFLFRKARWPEHRYDFLGEGEALGRPAVRIGFHAIAPYREGRNEWDGEAWVDRDTAQILRVEARRPDDYAEQSERLPTIGEDLSLREKVTTEFSVEKNGMRFVGLIRLQTFRVDPETGEWSALPARHVEQAYRGYRFFEVSTAAEIHDLVFGD